MIHDINKKCRMFSSVNKTNISITDNQTGERIDYYNFDIPKFIEKNVKSGITELFEKYGPLLDHQVIMYIDRLRFCWLVYILEDKDENSYIVRLGPFLNEIILVEQIKYYGHRMKLAVENIKILENFYSKSPVYEETQIRNIFMILTNILKGELDDIELIVENRDQYPPADNKYSGKFAQYDFAEHNYEIEGQFLKLIEKGDADGLTAFINNEMNNIAIPTRHQYDPLRNAKNLALTANSISARAALKGGLNPHLVHSISTKYAIEIEKQINADNVTRLIITLIIEFCESVKNYSLAKYSLLIKKAIVFIRKNLSEQISLDDIARELHVNGAYLSRAFKNDTGKNITNYIHETKIRESLPLVKSKSHRIIEIAHMFGYCNTAYFSTKFKKVMGVSPREWQQTTR